MILLIDRIELRYMCIFNTLSHENINMKNNIFFNDIESQIRCIFFLIFFRKRKFFFIPRPCKDNG